MHNTSIENAEFQITFTETNLRWLLGETTPNPEKIARCEQQIKDAKSKLQSLQAGAR